MAGDPYGRDSWDDRGDDTYTFRSAQGEDRGSGLEPTYGAPARDRDVDRDTEVPWQGRHARPGSDNGYGADPGRAYGERPRGYLDRRPSYDERDRGYVRREHQYPEEPDPDIGYGGTAYADPSRGFPDQGRGFRDPGPGYGGPPGRHSHDGGRDRDFVDRLDDDDDARAPTSWRRRVRERRKNMPLWQELPLLLVVAFCLAVLIRTFLVQAFYIPSGSMEETLLVGDRVLVNKILYDVRDPARGEIVVFRGTDNWAPENQSDANAGFFAKLGHTVGDLVGISQPGEKDFIKRVIGLPGDVVACCDVQGRVTVNSYPLDESSYVTEDSPLEVPPSPRECRSRRFDPVTVQPGQMFVMGDHRVVSQDSRCQGQVPISNVIGRAFVILWPSGRWDWLTVPKTFENVPKPYTAMPAPHRPVEQPGSPRGPDAVPGGAGTSRTGARRLPPRS
jgi:signal peptidase I